ncbi:MAG: hypothetical protein L0229_06345 [Blastocatellia bacterium]|nr:hypothetical protein [Blastocatellia bacterium]
MRKQDVEQNVKAALLDDLIKQQHVVPINDLDEVSRLWPADDDPDLLLEFLLNERSQRRQMNTERK